MSAEAARPRVSQRMRAPTSAYSDEDDFVSSRSRRRSVPPSRARHDGEEAVDQANNIPARSRRHSRRAAEQRRHQRSGEELFEPDGYEDASFVNHRSEDRAMIHGRGREARRHVRRDNMSNGTQVARGEYDNANLPSRDRATRTTSRRVKRREDVFVDANEDPDREQHMFPVANQRRAHSSERQNAAKQNLSNKPNRTRGAQRFVGSRGNSDDDQDRMQTGDQPNDDIAIAANDPPRSSRKRQLASVPGGQVNTVEQGRRFPMTGIDNLGLLMEDESYQPACFSIYMFKTKLDYRTVRNFFEVLLQLYPKYRYVIDFQPYSAARRDRNKRKELQRLEKASDQEKEAYRQEVEEAKKAGRQPFNRGPHTWYARSLKAGSWFRPAQWRIDDDFHVSENINVMSCGGTGDDAQLHRIAGRFLSRHFDFNKPVWEALLVQGLNTSEGAKSALMIKIHHSFSDGQGMIQSYHAALTALDKGMGIKEVQQWVDIAKSKERAGKEKIKPTIGGTIAHSLYTMRELYFRKRNSFVYQNPKAARNPQRLYSHSEGIGMAKIKTIREAFSKGPTRLTLNDVAIAILSDAMRMAASEMHTKKNDRRTAIFVPISRRPPGNWDLYNYTTGGIAWLRHGNGSADSVEHRLAQVQHEMLRLKKSYLPSIWFNTFDAFCKHRIFYLPNYPGWHQFFYRAFSEYHVATNVPGPTEEVSFGKHKAYSYHVLPPSSPGKATMAIGMISYAQDFSLAVSCDDVPEFRRVPELLCEAFEHAARSMYEAAERKLAGREDGKSSAAM
ncbi:hypothetical protein MYAM1_000908 [Malassezia yamatoensis]|uniref:Diacylglycerol O-acyltransferase n=1 Tax=Malassezia yamatoensis TaxID=253288 RepID=A0AAJ5YXC6_9BASI|nr:hypothetical protein MYAM1_000908 [Malassezia yamatoensis]